jgi:hypothetical protein
VHACSTLNGNLCQQMINEILQVIILLRVEKRNRQRKTYRKSREERNGGGLNIVIVEICSQLLFES